MVFSAEAITAVCAVLAMIGTLLVMLITKIMREEMDRLLVRIDELFVRKEVCDSHRTTELVRIEGCEQRLDKLEDARAEWQG